MTPLLAVTAVDCPPQETWSTSTQMWVLIGVVSIAALLWLVLIILAKRGRDVAKGWPIDRWNSR